MEIYSPLSQYTSAVQRHRARPTELACTIVQVFHRFNKLHTLQIFFCSQNCTHELHEQMSRNLMHHSYAHSDRATATRYDPYARPALPRDPMEVEKPQRYVVVGLTVDDSLTVARVLISTLACRPRRPVDPSEEAYLANFIKVT